MKGKTVKRENRRFIHGAMMINAPAAALNLGDDGIKRVYAKGENGESIRFSYLSGQFIKAKIREVLKEKGENLSKPEIIQVSGKKNTPTTSCNPFEYIDDDLFGYMNVIEQGNHINPGTTRVAPFKISYFLGKEGDINKDFAVKQNGALDDDGKLTTMPLDDNNRLFASTTYSGVFSIDVNMVGRFFIGSVAGYKNLAETFPVDNYKDKIEFKDESEVVLKKEERQRRLEALLRSFPYLYGGARLTTVYSDLAPKFIVLCVTDSGNHLFQELSGIYEHLNVKALIEAVTDYRETLKSDIYIALKNGFLDSKRTELLEAFKQYNNSVNKGQFKFVYNENLSGINDIVRKFTEEVLPELFKIEGI